MFYFIKGLPVFCIVTEPCADRFLLFGGFPISLHHVLDVGGFGGRKEGLVPFRGEMYNRVNGSPEHLACLVENIGNDIQYVPARFQRTLQLSYGLVLLRRCPAHLHADAVLFTGLLLPKLPQSRVPLGFISVSDCHSTVALQFDRPLRLGQLLCPLCHLFPDGIGERFFDMLVLGFQSRVLLLDGCVLALAEKVGDAGLYAVRVLPVNLSRAFLLFGDFAVKFLTAPLLFLVSDLELFMFGLGIVRFTDRGIPIDFGCFLFRLYLFGFLLLLGEDEVSAFKMLLSRLLL